MYFQGIGIRGSTSLTSRVTTRGRQLFFFAKYIYQCHGPRRSDCLSPSDPCVVTSRDRNSSHHRYTQHGWRDGGKINEINKPIIYPEPPNGPETIWRLENKSCAALPQSTCPLHSSLLYPPSLRKDYPISFSSRYDRSVDLRRV